MELWVRSQNGEVLTKCHCLGLEEQSGGKWSVLNYDGLEFYQYLGIYDYEKALEVLDEIQDIISGNNIAIVYGTISEDEFISVYVMPEE